MTSYGKPQPIGDCVYLYCRKFLDIKIASQTVI